MKYLLKNGTVVSGEGSRQADVLIDGEKIVDVGRNLDAEGAEILDAAGKLLFPGFIDGHTHFDLEVAGTVTADDFETGTKAALLGGTTFVVDYASQDKGGHTLREGLKKWHDKADGKCSCDYSFHMSVVEWNPETEAEIQDMIDEGITSFKLYMTYPAMIVDDCDLYKILKKLGQCGCFAGVHCENAGVIDALIAEAKKEGRLGPENHPLVRPDTMEAEAVHRLLAIAKEADAPVMIVHLTNKKAYEEVMAARKKGQTVYAETCPQYLLLEDSVYSKPDFEGAVYVCAPPIRKKEDQDCLWEALGKEEIQTVATDQCSFSLEQKALGREDFTKIPGGLPGVQTRGTLLYTYGVREGKITEVQMCKLLSENPAKLYGVYPRKGVIQPGSDADIVILDPSREDVISAKTHAYNTDNNPFEGFKLGCKIDDVFLRGHHAVAGGKLKEEKLGTFIRREKNML
ncbi:MAG: dihydropyrimidinase [Blautia sp.]|uniref:dihydropyrimidinase n=1 Tax=Blautia sp. TaxID=1955243 RepID=UPI002A74773F|nr:dihydropyrimidinase [Blautia sp.]MDY3015688.1 dihydropyrimidinase [Blautia sp.]